jgi:hypothetical protein
MKIHIIWKILAVPAVAFLAAFIYDRATWVEESKDLAAYTYLIRANNTDNVETAKFNAQAARACASDQKLYRLADQMCSAAAAMENAHIVNIKEVGSISGYEKLLEYGLSNPGFLPKSVYEVIRNWNLQDQVKEVDAIYSQRLNDYQIQYERHVKIRVLILRAGIWLGAGLLLLSYFYKPSTKIN